VSDRQGDLQVDLFIPSFPADIPTRDQQDLMERPFFSLSKRRLKPIVYKVGDTWIRITANPDYGMATIWDADILIWLSSVITEQRDAGLPVYKRIKVVPYDILKYIKRGTSGTEYKKLKQALGRLQSTTVETNIRQGDRKRAHQFSFINEFIERVDNNGKVIDVEIVIADWFYDGVMTNNKILTINPGYFELMGGIERWLYRVLRKHAGKQENGWSFTFTQLYTKSGSPDRITNFAIQLRKIIKKGTLLEYSLTTYTGKQGDEVLHAVRRSTLPPGHEHATGIELPNKRLFPKI